MMTEQITGAGGEIIRPHNKIGRNSTSSKKEPVRSVSSTQDKVEISQTAKNFQSASSANDALPIDDKRMEAIARRIKENHYFQKEVIENVADTLLQTMWK